MTVLFLQLQTPPTLASTHWEAFLLLTWPIRRMDLPSEHKVCSNAYLILT